MMEGEGGCSIIDVLIRDGRRRSVFRAYTFPYMDRPNLTVLTHAQVLKVTFQDRRATGVELVREGKQFRQLLDDVGGCRPTKEPRPGVSVRTGSG
jgi:choline dehydrogenase